MLQLINIRSWAAAGSLINQSRAAADQIDDPAISAEIDATLQNQLDGLSQNVEFLGFMNIYAWFFIAVIIFVILYLYIREQKEVQGVYG